MSDRDIQKAIKAGEQNQRMKELVHNWCQHARVEKAGGTGLVEMETGLPIGHHFMACDHASAAGMATWDLADAAIDFHDRNCVDCTKRVAVRMPNLSILIGQRDRHITQQKQHQEKLAAERSRAFEARELHRKTVRSTLQPSSYTTIDQLHDLDSDSSESTNTQFVETARLAPEIFSPAIVELLFSYLERDESWAFEASLNALFVLKANPTRLTECAARILPSGIASKSAKAILLTHSDLIPEKAIDALLPVATYLADPPHLSFQVTRSADSSLLLALKRRAPKDFSDCVERRLNARHARDVCIGAAAALAIGHAEPASLMRHLKTIVALLARLEQLVDFDDERYRDQESELKRDLERSLSLALKHDPSAADNLVNSYLATSRDEGQERLLSPYRHLFWESRFDQSEITAEQPYHDVGLKRLIGACLHVTTPKVVGAVLETLRSRLSEALFPLVRRNLSYLLGAVVLFDDNCAAIQSKYDSEKEFLRKMEYNNTHNTYHRFQEELINWCVTAAADNSAATKEYLQVLSGVPSARTSLRGMLIKALSKLMQSVDGMNAALPYIYGSMVGTCQVARAAAVKAIGKIGAVRRSDLPALIFEAYVISLTDPYVIVHKAAVGLLETFEPPEGTKSRVRNGLEAILLTYIQSKSDDEFLMKCISIYASQFASPKVLDGEFGALLVQAMARMDARHVLDRLGWIHKRFENANGFGPLVVGLLGAAQTERNTDQVARVLRELSPKALYSLRLALEKVVTDNISERDVGLLGDELLTYAGAWESATRISQKAVEAISETARERPRRLFFELVQAAVAFEAAASRGDHLQQSNAGGMWRDISSTIQQDKKANESRRDPLRSFRGQT